MELVNFRNVKLLVLTSRFRIAPIKEAEFSSVFNAFIGRFIKAVDVLFFYSGFFTIYAWHDLIKSGKLKYDFHTVFYTKYVRYAIVIAIMILITFILPRIGSGPRYSVSFLFGEHFSKMLFDRRPLNCAFHPKPGLR